MIWLLFLILALVLLWPAFTLESGRLLLIFVAILLVLAFLSARGAL